MAVEQALYPPFLAKVILTDYDKSLSNSRREISPRTWEVLRQAFVQSLPIGLCTGRTFPLVLGFLSQFPADYLHIVGGGGQVVDSRGNVRWSQELSGEVLGKVCRQVQNLGGWFGFAQGDTFFGHREILSRMATVTGVKMEQIDANLIPAKWNTPLIVVGGLTPKLIAFVESLPGIAHKKMVSYAGDDYYDITAKGVTKARALVAWSELTKIPLAKVVGIGDGLNDIEFLQQVGWPVVMSNSHPDLLRQASVVIGHVDEDGWPKYVSGLLSHLAAMQSPQNNGGKL